MFVPNFTILCQAVPEKSLTEKKFTHTHTHTHTHKHLHRKDKNYIPPIYFVYAGGITKNLLLKNDVSRLMRKQSAYAKPKALISFAVSAKLISALVYAIRKVQFVYFLNPKFPASRQLLCLNSLVCVEPVRKPHSWFSHETAHF